MVVFRRPEKEVGVQLAFSKVHPKMEDDSATKLPKQVGEEGQRNLLPMTVWSAHKVVGSPRCLSMAFEFCV